MIERMLAMLKELACMDLSINDYDGCPLCGCDSCFGSGHHDGCRLAALIAEAEANGIVADKQVYLHAWKVLDEEKTT